MGESLIVALIVTAVGIVCASLAIARPRTLHDASIGCTQDPADSSVSVIVPARNEARSLPILLASLRASLVVPDQIIVVDDSSDDDTAAVAQAYGASVIAAEPLPPGWAGKPWACSTGAAAATSRTLVFLDADTWLSPTALGKLTLARGAAGGLCSVQPFHTPLRMYEELSALFNASAVLGCGWFGIRRSSHGTERAAVAFGPCIAVDRGDYESLGGHAAVQGSVIEDIALAQAFAAAGHPIDCWLGGRDVGFRMYPDGFRSLIQGWTKNIALGASQASRGAVAATTVWIGCLAGVAVNAAADAVSWIGGGPFRNSAGWMIAYSAMAVHLFWVLRRVGSFAIVTSLLFPLPLLFFLAIFGKSAVTIGRGRPAMWRGRKVAVR